VKPSPKTPKLLLIADNSGAAMTLAKALGIARQTKGYYESENTVITHASAQMFTVREPASFIVEDVYSFINLPVIPDRLDLLPSEASKDQINIIGQLLKRDDISAVCNACRETPDGEFLFHGIMRHFRCHKPVRRLRLGAMTEEGIRQSFSNLSAPSDAAVLGEAAICRAQINWLVGTNCSRAITALRRQWVEDAPPIVFGRLQALALNILARREQEIQSFRPSSCFQLTAHFRSTGGSYKAAWFDVAFKNSANAGHESHQLRNRRKLEEIELRCRNKSGTASSVTVSQFEPAPLFFDLATFQEEAAARLGMSALGALRLARVLFEKHKVLTNPYTDSRHLPIGNVQAVKQILRALESSPTGEYACKALNMKWVESATRLFNNALTQEGYAIVPTGSLCNNLTAEESAVYNLVARRFVSAFFPPARFDVTKCITQIGNYAFKSESSVLREAGWLEVNGERIVANESNENIPTAEHQQTTVLSLDVEECATTAPSRFTETSLLAAMRDLNDNPEATQSPELSLGTAVVRAQVIGQLLRNGFARRDGHYLCLTSRGRKLVALLRSLEINTLCYPTMGADLERKIHLVEKGLVRPSDVYLEAAHVVANAVKKIKQASERLTPDCVSGYFQDLDVSCPRCLGLRGFRESITSYTCKGGCGLAVPTFLGGRELDSAEVIELLTSGCTPLLSGFKESGGRTFTAKLRLKEDTGWKIVLDSGEEKLDPPKPFDKSIAALVADTFKFDRKPDKVVFEFEKARKKAVESSGEELLLSECGATKTWVASLRAVSANLHWTRHVAILGYGPFSTDILRSIISLQGHEIAPAGDYRAGVLVVGRNDCSLDVVLQHIKSRGSSPLRIYSQEMVMLALFLGNDPFKADQEVLEEMGRSHPILAALMEGPFEWPVLIQSDLRSSLTIDVDWNPNSPLTAMGYHVGRGYTDTKKRRSILARIVESQLVFPAGTTETLKTKWGAPYSKVRLRKIAAHFRLNVNLPGKKPTHLVAAKHWLSDYRWLGEKYGQQLRMKWPEL
jgi:DNA topoisomerase-3